MSTADLRLEAADFSVPKNAGLLKLVIVLATMMQVLDMTIANVALPHMQAALGANQDSVTWVLTSYIVAAAITIPITGWLSDRLGRRTLYLWSVSLFVGSSVLCGIAANIEEMVAFRILQGVSGAFLSPLAQAVLLDTTPPEKRGQAMALFGMGVVLGPILGPILGAWLTDNFNWRWVFFVNVPLGALAFAGLWLFLPRTERLRRPLDLTGFALLAIALASLQIMLDRGEHQDWFYSVEIWVELMISLSAFWMFAVHVMTASNPLYGKGLLGNRNLAIGAILMSVLGFIMTTAMVLLPLMLEGLFGYPIMATGELLASRGAGVILMMGITGYLLPKVDPRLVIASGIIIVALTFWDMSGWSLQVSWSRMAMNGFFQGLGLGMLFVPITTLAFATLPLRYRTDGSAIINLSRSVGSSVGISVVIALLSRQSATSHSDLAAHLTPYRLWIDPQVMAMPGDALDVGLSLLNAEVTRQASMIAFLDDFRFMMIVAILAIPLSLLVKPSARTGKSSGNRPVIE